MLQSEIAPFFTSGEFDLCVGFFFKKKYLCAWFNCMLQYVAGILSDEQKRWVQVEGLFAEVDLNIPDFLKISDPPTSDHMNFMRNWKYFHKS